jgi:hypothetical protein
MELGRLALVLLILLVLPMMSPGWVHAKDKHTKVKDYEEGRAFCPPRALVIGNVLVPAGRCYTLAVLRDPRGAFLAFMDPSVQIPSGKIERLDDSEGRKVKRHIFFLVPIQPTARIALVPVNTIQLIRLHEEDEEDEDEDAHNVHLRRSTLIVALPNLPVPNVSVTFVVTF